MAVQDTRAVAVEIQGTGRQTDKKSSDKLILMASKIMNCNFEIEQDG